MEGRGGRMGGWGKRIGERKRKWLKLNRDKT